MNEVVVDFRDISQTLEPVFGGKSVKIVFQKSKAIISEETRQSKPIFNEKRAKAIRELCGICHDRANPELRKIEREAYINGIVEKYAKNINT
jgi:hypothetical protein